MVSTESQLSSRELKCLSGSDGVITVASRV